MEENVIVVVPGHYCSKQTINSESKDIIKVLGPSDREGYWVLDDKRVLNEYVITEDYVLLDTAWSNSSTKQKNNFLDGFKPTTNNYYEPAEDSYTDGYAEESYTDGYDEDSYIVQNQEESYYKSVQHPNQQNKKGYELSPEEEKRKQMEFIIQKANVDYLNKINDEKYGVKPYKEFTFTIPLEISINYDLKKLSVICELFELDNREVAEFLFDEIEIPHTQILSNIMDFLRMKNDSTEDVQMSIKPVETEKEVIKETPIQTQIKDDLNQSSNEQESNLAVSFFNF